MNDDPKPELYAILDEAKLTGSNMLQNKSMTSIVTKVRKDIVEKTAAYIERRERKLNRSNVN